MYRYLTRVPYQHYPSQAPYQQHPPHAFYQQYPPRAPCHQYAIQVLPQAPHQQYYQWEQQQQQAFSPAYTRLYHQPHQGPIYDGPDPYKPQSMPGPAKIYEYDIGLLTQQSANYPSEAVLVGIAKRGRAAGSGPAKSGIQATALRREVEAWGDKSLLGWSSTWFKLLIDGLSDDISDDALASVFTKYRSFKKACIVRDRSSQKANYGLVAFSGSEDFLKAWKEMEGTYVGECRIRLKRADTDAIGLADAGYYKLRQPAWWSEGSSERNGKGAA